MKKTISIALGAVLGALSLYSYQHLATQNVIEPVPVVFESIRPSEETAKRVCAAYANNDYHERDNTGVIVGHVLEVEAFALAADDIWCKTLAIVEKQTETSNVSHNHIRHFRLSSSSQLKLTPVTNADLLEAKKQYDSAL
ncbi:hypothetical protein [Aliagarivorans taiwanensis]|uniref:hypothetical protein n=1 Tax=Aliagarivorans taiwanensis TaxID=561966 RepID=UPI000478F495|nr:hypothetical protein [Aliagarivorans taiwanensis]